MYLLLFSLVIMRGFDALSWQAPCAPVAYNKAQFLFVWMAFTSIISSSVFITCMHVGYIDPPGRQIIDWLLLLVEPPGVCSHVECRCYFGLTLQVSSCSSSLSVQILLFGLSFIDYTLRHTRISFSVKTNERKSNLLPWSAHMISRSDVIKTPCSCHWIYCFQRVKEHNSYSTSTGFSVQGRLNRFLSCLHILDVNATARSFIIQFFPVFGWFTHTHI